MTKEGRSSMDVFTHKLSEVEKLFKILGLLPLDRHLTEVCVPFIKGMVLRMCLSREKYGAVKDGYPEKVDAIGSLKVRLQKYEETGNTEYLMDVGNFAMIEFMLPRHPKAHYKATDSNESPGRLSTTGVVGQASNDTGTENLRRGGSRLKTSGGFYAREGD